MASGLRRAACGAIFALVVMSARAQDVDDHSQHQRPAQSEVHDHASHAEHSRSEDATESERTHVPPDPPANPMPDVSEERMIELMRMEDDAALGMVLLDQLEWRANDDENSQAWELQSWYGTDYNKIWFETEGERVRGEEAGRAELLWDRILSTWWSVQAGIRQDFSEGPSRTWAAVGLQGLAPYFFEIDTAVYIAEQGRTAARFSAEYDLLITQRLVLQPEVEFELYGKDDPANAIGSGLSNAEVGLRLRYEIRRELAPYIGVQWERKFGETADMAREQERDTHGLVFIAGIRAWF